MKEVLLKPHVRIWLAIVGASTLVLGASYTMVQQSTRLAANDLPEATAQAIKNQLDSGASPSDVIPGQVINLESNNNVFAIVTDDSRHVLASSATLDGQTPLPPKGVFDFTAVHGVDHFTWQPNSSVRLATYVQTYGKAGNNGFIITGQQLAPAEDRIAVYGDLALAAWLAVIAWTFFIMLLPRRPFAKRN